MPYGPYQNTSVFWVPFSFLLKFAEVYLELSKKQLNPKKTYRSLSAEL